MKRKRTDVFQKIDMSPDQVNEDGRSLGCWNWTGGFHKRSPYWNYDGRKLVPYRVVYKLVHGDAALPNNMLILHSCDNRRCCNPGHMSVGTNAENMEEMEDRDRHGMNAHMVRYIVKLLGQGRTHAEIAELYGCSRETVTKIANGHVHKRHSGSKRPEIEELKFDPSERKEQ